MLALTLVLVARPMAHGVEVVGAGGCVLAGMMMPAGGDLVAHLLRG